MATISSKYTSEALSILGLPPQLYYQNSDTYRINLPILHIIPGLPKYDSPTDRESGIKLYTFDPEAGIDQFDKIMLRLGISKLTKFPLKVAFLNESGFSENFSNSYSDSNFESMANFGVPFAQELQYLTGKRTLGEAVQEVAKKYNAGQPSDQKLQLPTDTSDVGALSSFFKDAAGKIGGGALNLIAGGVKGLEEIGSQFLPNAAFMNLMAGHDLDFPMIWRGSSYTPNYSVTVRLYNPMPQDDDMLEFHIIEPLAKLLAFVMPISTSSTTYNYPLLCRVEAPGLFKIKSGYVASIDVMKGGDANDISDIQRVGHVDVRITFGELYNTMVTIDDPDENPIDPDRPTLEDYLDVLRGKTKVNISRDPREFFTESVIDIGADTYEVSSLPDVGRITSATEATEPTSRVNGEFLTKYGNIMSQF